MSYIVDNKGAILFSSQDFTTIFRTYIWGPNLATPVTFLVTEKMGDKDVFVTVEAGTFITSAFRQVYTFQSGIRKGDSLVSSYRYAKNIGLIKESHFYTFNTPQLLERRLMRYRVQ